MRYAYSQTASGLLFLILNTIMNINRTRENAMYTIPIFDYTLFRDRFKLRPL